MSDPVSIDLAIKLLSNFGIPGIVLIIWAFSDKSHERTLKQYREDMVEQRRMYEEGIQEIRRMYENNADLARDYLSLAGSLKDIVVLNTQAWQRACDDINRNQFCPQVRRAREGRE